MAREQARYFVPGRGRPEAPPTPVPVAPLCQECGRYASYHIAPPAQPRAERWCGRCVPQAFFAWRSEASV